MAEHVIANIQALKKGRQPGVERWRGRRTTFHPAGLAAQASCFNASYRPGESGVLGAATVRLTERIRKCPPESGAGAASTSTPCFAIRQMASRLSCLRRGDLQVQSLANSTCRRRMRSDPPPELTAARDAIVTEVERLRIDRHTPLLVVIDGGSGAGKSILASMVAKELGAALVQSDDFYASDVSDAEWDSKSPGARVADVIDWRRLRAEALEPLLRAEPAEWHAFDFGRVRPDGTYPLRREPTRRDPAPVIVLDGAYSSRPEVADLVDLSVLVDSPVDVRHRRLSAREDREFLSAWHARWDAAEEYYFGEVRPKSSFDLVVAN
jgi:uridine kinase